MYEYEGPTIAPVAETRRKARKVHYCADCGGEIRPGETYYRLVQLVDGDICAAPRHASAPYCVEYPPDDRD